jgi:hypothetical protein
MADHCPKAQEVLERLVRELVEYFDSGIVVVTFHEGGTTKNGFVKFGNDYTIEGMVANIHDILYAQDEEDEEDDDDDGESTKIKSKTI